MNHMENLADVLNDAQKKGYDRTFELHNGKLRCKESGEEFTPDQLKIVNHYRFEGISNPDDMSAIYLVESSTGAKGTIIDAYGTYSDQDLSQFLHGIPVEEDR